MPAQGRVHLLQRERLQLCIDLSGPRKRAADVQIASQRAGHRRVLGTRQPPEAQQTTLAFGKFLRREAVLQCTGQFLKNAASTLGWFCGAKMALAVHCELASKLLQPIELRTS